MKISILITVAVVLVALVSVIDAEKRTPKEEGKQRGGGKRRSRQNRRRHQDNDSEETRVCEDISEKQKQRKLRGAQKAYEKTAPMRLAEELKKDDGRRKRYAEMECPATQAEYTDISKRAISPWTWELNVDVDRYPTAIAKAKCLCPAGCLVNGKVNHNYVSEPIYSKMKVLRRTKCDKKGKYRYKVEWENVPVGCTCAKPQY